MKFQIIEITGEHSHSPNPQKPGIWELSGVKDANKLHLTETKSQELQLPQSRINNWWAMTDRGHEDGISTTASSVFSGLLLPCAEQKLFALGVFWEYNMFLFEKGLKNKNKNVNEHQLKAVYPP